MKSCELVQRLGARCGQNSRSIEGAARTSTATPGEPIAVRSSRDRHGRSACPVGNGKLPLRPEGARRGGRPARSSSEFATATYYIRPRLALRCARGDKSYDMPRQGDAHPVRLPPASRFMNAMPSPTTTSGLGYPVNAVMAPARMIAMLAIAPLRADRNAARPRLTSARGLTTHCLPCDCFGRRKQHPSPAIGPECHYSVSVGKSRCWVSV